MKPQRAAKRRRPIPWGRLALALAGLVVLLLGTTGVSLYSLLSGFQCGGTAAARVPLDDRINILVLGIDMEGDSVHRSDTMMLVSLDPLTRSAGVLSIPRDTLTSIRGRPAKEKIAHAYAYGGPDLAMETVSRFAGVPVHYYVRLDFRGFKALVDAIGGVTVDVEKPMRYVDPYQNLNINLPKGLRKLDGDEAMQYVRYRQDGDIPRIHRQQKFLRAAIDQAWSLTTAPRLPGLIRELSRYVNTNMSPDAIMRVAGLAAATDRSRIAMGTVPTEPVRNRYGDYFGEKADEAGLREAVDRLIRGVDREANGRLTIGVLAGNGGFADDVAKVSRLLKEQGYRVEAGGRAGQEFRHLSVIYQQEEFRDAAVVLARSFRHNFGRVDLRQGGRSEWFAGDGSGGRDIVVVTGSE